MNPEDARTSRSRRILSVFGHLLWPRKANARDPNLLRVQPYQELNGFALWYLYEFLSLWHDIFSSKNVKSAEDPYSVSLISVDDWKVDVDIIE